MSKTTRCPDCDRDGEVLSKGVYVDCPRCKGSMRVQKEEQPMNEESLYRWLMISAAVLAVMCGLGAVALVVLCALTWSWGVLLCAILMAVGAIGAGYITVMFSTKTTVPKVFNNQDEREVLNLKQRKELRKARGEVVMERALIEVEHERQNIVHKQIEEANNPELPPHQTRWSTPDVIRQLHPKTDPVEEWDQ
jgi:hypothetical protein